MASLLRGTIVLVPFPYSDLRGMKRRPACVVSVNEYQLGPDVIVAMVTSSRARLQSPGLGDVVVADWASAGLRSASTVRTGRLLVLEQRLIAAEIGRLSSGAIVDLDRALEAVFGLS
ncbi:MAG: type II toxin-antitoxin system PemK/MazF family toxin [Acidimicrobiales bacterium]